MARADEHAAVIFLESLRWGDNGEHECPRCQSRDVYMVMDRKEPEKRNADFRWRCRSCGKYHTVRTGAVMEDSRVPLRHWCLAFRKACSSKKGISAKQIQRETGLSYKSARFLMHRVRFALAEIPSCKLTETVEVDETVIGGKPRPGGPPRKTGRGTLKQPVMGMVQRNGDVMACGIPDVTGKTLKGTIRENVDPAARTITDEFPSYRGVGGEFAGGHETVNHNKREYSRDDVFTNTAESFFALIKHGVYGLFHAVSKRHLHRYIDEFVFWWNTRKDSDRERVAKAVLGSAGKRLMYREPQSLWAG